jgi:DNA-directed RNA polymerase specialized sigma24 family protein
MDEGAMGRQPPSDTPQVPPAARARTEGDEPFPVAARISGRDRRAFAEEILDRHAGEVYGYVLAWTNDRTAAHELTVQVLRAAVARMERLAEPDTDVEARLVALARDAVARRIEAESQQPQAPARDAGAFAASEPVPLLLEAVARLDDARREVMILRQLLGHSTEHAARLLAFDVPVVEELERSACATLWRRLNHAQETQTVTAWDALTVAAALRRGAPTWFAPPGEATMAALREQLLGDVDPDRRGPAAAVAAWDRRRLLSAVLTFAMRRRWLVAGCVASATIGMVAALTIGGQASQSSHCGDAQTCLVSTSTEGVADTVPALPSSPPEQSSGLPTSTTRAGAGAAFPAMTGVTRTTSPFSTTTTMRGTASTPTSTRPRRTTTTTTRPPTSTTSAATTSTTGATTTTTVNG